MTNPWLAIDVATAPITRARELRRAWERFVVGSRTGEGDSRDTPVRAPIADSWRRSAAAGVDPSGLRIAPQVADADEASARWEIHPLAEMAPLIRSCLAATADESQHLIVVSDAKGVLLWVEGNATVRLRAADSMNFAEGTLWSEGGAGTNAIGTAIAAKHAVQVFASEHFNEIVQRWTCAAAPVHDPTPAR
jgi:transcriptional regulator of acetoin/glycerol metabolism